MLFFFPFLHQQCECYDVLTVGPPAVSSVSAYVRKLKFVIT